MNGISLKLVAVSAALVLLPAAPASAQALPGAGVISNEVTETTAVRVAINGGTAGLMKEIGYDDAPELRRGLNRVVVTWAGPVARIAFRIRYGASEKQVKDVLVVRADAAHDARLRRAGSRTYTFTI